MELTNLSFKNLITLLLTDSISVNDEVRWLQSLLAFENQNSFLNQDLHLVFYKLLTLRLADVVREVLTHSFVGASCKPNDGLLTCMTNVNSN